MKKVIEFIKWPLTFPVWAMVALYLFWILSVPIEFVDLEAYILGVIILCIYLVATILIKTFYKREYLSIGLWILLVPLMLVSTLVTLWFVFESIKYFDLLSRGNREFTSYVLGMLVLSIYPAKMLFWVSFITKRECPLLAATSTGQRNTSANSLGRCFKF